MSEQPIHQSLEQVLRRVRDIPSLPQTINTLLSKIALPDTSASEIARLISYDPGLVTKVLRMVNSAAYGFPRQISSIQHAIMILGFNTVRGLVLSASILKLFEGNKSRAQGLDHHAFWKHAILTALISKAAAQYFQVANADETFSAGLLHDIGKIVLDIYYTEDYEKVLLITKQQKVLPHGNAFLDIEHELLVLDHADLGFHLAQRWKLPQNITEAIQFHHRPWEVDAPLVYVIALGNELARGVQYHLDMEALYWVQPEILAYFDLDPEGERYQSFLTRIRAELETADDLLYSLIGLAPKPLQGR